MCGIVGYLNLNNTELDGSEPHLSRMCKSIIHRGPDEQGMKFIGPVALGMTRLSIIDLATGQQPITNEDGSVWLVFNGEIYNFQELREQLLKAGHTFSTKSDTEVIVHLYEEHGVQCLKYLEGMFSFALWDINKERLLLARDRMGEKPLHWGIFGGKLIFGSEIKGILEHPDARRNINLEALHRYLALEYVPAPHSMFEGIHKLLPAHYMLVENGETRTFNYWEPDYATVEAGEQEAADELLRLLKKSIELRLISDVPLGVFLSGGIDSSSIAALALASEAVKKPLKTFSIGFSDPSFDESMHARAVAGHIGADHHLVTFLPELAFATMQELWNFLDEPLADASIVPTYFLSKMTRQEVTVALAGEGGDELFGGYPTYMAHRLARVWNAFPRPLRENVLAPAIRSLPVSLRNLSFDYKIKRFISAADEPPVRRHLRWMGSIPLEQQAKLLRPEAAPAVSRDSARYQEELLLDYPNLPLSQDIDKDVIKSIMRVDMTSYLADDLLVKSDRASMAASLEVRLPFLAFPLIEFALKLPSSYKVRGMTTKYLLKKAVAPYLPEKTIKRPKKGFGIPVGQWLKNEFRPLVDEYLCESFVTKQSLFEFAYIQQMLNEHDRGYADRRKELWTLLMFQCWWQKFFM